MADAALMRRRRGRPIRIATWLLGLTVVAAACSGPIATAGPPGGQEVWRTAELRDVLSGETFRLADLEGKVVVIETMAVWCSNCRIQQHEAKAALERLGSPTDVVYISLDVDPREREAELADYARREGFGWRFVVSSAEVSRALAASFGNQVLSPPSTPLVILGPDGQVVEHHTGILRSDGLVAMIESHLP